MWTSIFRPPRLIMRTGQTRRIMKLCSLFSIFLSWLIFLVNCLESCANIAKVLKFSKFLLYTWRMRMYLRSFICSWTYYVFSYLTIWSAILFVPFWWVLTGEWPNLLCSKCQRIDENCNKYFLCFFQWLKTLQIRHCFFFTVVMTKFNYEMMSRYWLLDRELGWWRKGKIFFLFCPLVFYLGLMEFFWIFFGSCFALSESSTFNWVFGGVFNFWSYNLKQFVNQIVRLAVTRDFIPELCCIDYTVWTRWLSYM